MKKTKWSGLVHVAGTGVEPVNVHPANLNFLEMILKFSFDFYNTFTLVVFFRIKIRCSDVKRVILKKHTSFHATLLVLAR